MQKLLFQETLKKLGISQKELARRLSISPESLSRTLRQTEKGLSVNFLLKVADVLCVDVVEFFSKKEIPPPSKFRKGIINWPGGKSTELKILTPLFPKSYNDFYEPFVGGGSVFLNTNPTDRYYINDLSTELMNLYHCVADQNTLFLSTLEAFELHWKNYAPDWLNKIDTLYHGIPEALKFGKRPLESHTFPLSDETDAKSALYVYYRNLFNRADKLALSAPVKAALFFIMRSFSFSGIFRFNIQAHYNSPYSARYNRKSIQTYLDNYQSPEVQNIFARTTIENMDFEVFFEQASAPNR